MSRAGCILHFVRKTVCHLLNRSSSRCGAFVVAALLYCCCCCVVCVVVVAAVVLRLLLVVFAFGF